MALFTTGPGGGGLDPNIEALQQSNPAAYAAWNRWHDLEVARLNDPNEGGSFTRAARLAERRRLGYSATALAEAQQNLEQNYPAVWQYHLANRRSVGGLGQGGNELVAAIGLPAAAIALGGAGAGAAAGSGTGGGAATGGAAGGAAGGGAAAGGAGGATGGAAGGAAGGAGYSGLTDAAVETGIAGGLGSSGGGGSAGSGGSAGTGSSGGGFWDSLGNFIGSDTGQGLLNLGAGYLQNQQNQQASDKYAQAQIEAARIAAEAARFKPVGVTTRFGQSNFKFDDKGNLVSAGYTLSPEMKAQQDAIMGAITGNRSQGMMQPQNRQQPIGILPNGQPNYQYSIGMPQNPNQPPMLQVAGARANGGPVAGGQTYLVGENGPELFTAPTNGGIIPNQVGNAMANQSGMFSSNPYATGQSPGVSSIGNPQNPSNQNLSTFIPSTAYQGVVGNTNSGIGSPMNPNAPVMTGVMPNASGALPVSSGNQNWIGAPELNPNNRMPNVSVVIPTSTPVSNNQQSSNGGLLSQAVGAQETTAPLAQGSQSLFNLGQGYLATSPQEQAARYMQEQQALLAPSRERGLAQLQNQMHQQGRTGLATGGTSTMGAANPELEAFYNAQRQQDLALASQATQGGQQYAQFGAGLLGTGGEMLRNMYGTQSAAYQPYQTALGMMTGIEGLGQNAMDIGINLGSSGANAGANIGRMLQQGYGNAAEGRRQADQYSPWANLLQGASTWY